LWYWLYKIFVEVLFFWISMLFFFYKSISYKKKILWVHMVLKRMTGVVLAKPIYDTNVLVLKKKKKKKKKKQENSRVPYNQFTFRWHYTFFIKWWSPYCMDLFMRMKMLTLERLQVKCLFLLWISKKKKLKNDRMWQRWWTNKPPYPFLR